MGTMFPSSIQKINKLELDYLTFSGDDDDDDELKPYNKTDNMLRKSPRKKKKVKICFRKMSMVTSFLHI